MKTKLEYIMECVETSMVVLRFSTAQAAAKYRLSLYHWRNRAAIKDPRALNVKVSLRDTTVTLTYNQEEPHYAGDIQPTPQ